MHTLPVPHPPAGSILVVLAALVTTLCSAPSPAFATSGPIIDHAERSEVVLINRYRQVHGLRSLRIDGTLSRAATWMVLDMGRNARFAHVDSRGRDPFTRLRAFGYPSTDTWRGENLAAGSAGPTPTMHQWVTSPPHRRNMLDAHYRAIGIARIRVPGSPYRWYWATTFGSRWTTLARVRA